MAMNEAMLAEYDQEIATTRRFLERVPAADADWSPHAKSKTLGALAVHVAVYVPVSETPAFPAGGFNTVIAGAPFCEGLMVRE